MKKTRAAILFDDDDNRGSSTKNIIEVDQAKNINPTVKMSTKKHTL